MTNLLFSFMVKVTYAPPPEVLRQRQIRREAGTQSRGSLKRDCRVTEQMGKEVRG